MSGVGLIAFLLAIYLPHAFFKIWAERYIDLGRRRDASQFDDVVAPIIPSVLFHLQAWMVIHIICLIRNLIPFGIPWHFRRVDWNLILNVSSDGGTAHLASILNDSYELSWPGAYVAVVALVTFINAVAFGRGALIGIYAKANDSVNPGARETAEPQSVYGKIKLYVAASAFWAWKLFYWESFVPMFQWSVLKPFVFVKTKDGALFHGRFDSYEKAKDGQIDMITIIQASRFTRRPIREALRAGEHPLRPLKGSLVLKWSEVADINTTVPGEIRDLWKRYEKLREKDQAPQI